jgi:hypothetical protein
VGCAKTTKDRKKSQALGMTKERATFLWKVVSEPKAFFIAWVGRRPMNTPVPRHAGAGEMTVLFDG